MSALSGKRTLCDTVSAVQAFANVLWETSIIADAYSATGGATHSQRIYPPAGVTQPYPETTAQTYPLEGQSQTYLLD